MLQRGTIRRNIYLDQTTPLPSLDLRHLSLSTPSPLRHKSDQIPSNKPILDDLNEKLGQSKSSRLSLKPIKTLITSSYPTYRTCMILPSPGGCQPHQHPDKSNPEDSNDAVRLRRASLPSPKTTIFPSDVLSHRDPPTTRKKPHKPQ